MPIMFPGLILFIICMSGLSIAGTVFWIWMVVDCVMNKRLSDTQKALWAVLIIFTHLIGALIYFFVARSSQPKQSTYQYYVQPQTPYQHYQAPGEAYYQPYAQGYQAPPAQQEPHNEASRASYMETEQVQPQHTQDYEQPQAMYPQNPPE